MPIGNKYWKWMAWISGSVQGVANIKSPLESWIISPLQLHAHQKYRRTTNVWVFASIALFDWPWASHGIAGWITSSFSETGSLQARADQRHRCLGGQRHTAISKPQETDVQDHNHRMRVDTQGLDPSPLIEPNTPPKNFTSSSSARECTRDVTPPPRLESPSTTPDGLFHVCLTLFRFSRLIFVAKFADSSCSNSVTTSIDSSRSWSKWAQSTDQVHRLETNVVITVKIFNELACMAETSDESSWNSTPSLVHCSRRMISRSWNQNWLKEWIWKCRWFNSCQSWICFK
jgi:hypothetical protein